MGVTISTHNGSSAHRAHNIRDEKVVSKEKHINPDGVHEVWHDEAPSAAYERIFGNAVKKYNESQKRPERRVDNYYRQICKDKKKHPVYEMIIGVYGKDDSGLPLCSSAQGKAIMKKFIENWKERNPNLELIGAYYHADEEGSPHVHIDYIPVAHGYKRGMETQTGLVKALEEQGFRKSGKATAQIQWQARENRYLSNLCEDVGLTVDHPKAENEEHLETELYKAEKNVLQAQQEALRASQRLQSIKDSIKSAEEEKAALAALEEQIRHIQKDIDYLSKRKSNAYDWEIKQEFVLSDMEKIIDKGKLSVISNIPVLKKCIERLYSGIKSGYEMCSKLENCAYAEVENNRKFVKALSEAQEEIKKQQETINNLEKTIAKQKSCVTSAKYRYKAEIALGIDVEITELAKKMYQKDKAESEKRVESHILQQPNQQRKKGLSR